MPYGIYQILHNKRHRNIFFEEYDKYFRTKYIRDELINYSENKFYNGQVVSVQGLGYSGSGAILDLLCEIDGCDVIGKDEKANVLGNDHKGAFELDFLRLSGGLFELEKYINTDNVFQNDAMVKRFIRCVNAFPLFQKDQRVREFFYDFFYSILDFKIPNVIGAPFNPYLYDKTVRSELFFLKKIEVSHYRILCRKLLSSLFNHLNSNNDVIILDQVFEDNTFDLKKYQDYVPNSKLILCYRDPRDVYQFACDNSISWIAHNNAVVFVKWFKQMTRNVNIKTSEYLVVEFERLVLDYDRQTERILSYLGFNSEAHNPLLKRTFFDPNISKQNIGLWKKENGKQDDFEYIKEQLMDFCFLDAY
jgi:hypothetical protein